MQRQLMDELIAWKSRANRKPLLLLSLIHI